MYGSMEESKNVRTNKRTSIQHKRNEQIEHERLRWMMKRTNCEGDGKGEREEE